MRDSLQRSISEPTGSGVDANPLDNKDTRRKIIEQSRAKLQEKNRRLGLIPEVPSPRSRDARVGHIAMVRSREDETKERNFPTDIENTRTILLDVNKISKEEVDIHGSGFTDDGAEEKEREDKRLSDIEKIDRYIQSL